VVSNSKSITNRLACFITLALMVLPAAAHHSGAIYDDERDLRLLGAVKKFRWANPHVIIEIEVIKEAGETVTWAIEGLPPSGLRSAGWSPQSLNPVMR
jgi:hypothetical protein